MRPVPLVALSFLLIPCLQAQTKTTTSPPGFESIEGSTRALFPHDVKSSPRGQFIDEAFIGKGVKSFTQVEYRYDWTSYSSSEKYSIVSLDVGHLTTSGVSTTFSKNFRTSPTRVFESAMNFPGHFAGLKGYGPAKWLPTFAFPFSTPWKYSGATALILDYHLAGGSGHSWLDASSETGAAEGTGSRLAITSRGCGDSRRLSPAAYNLDAITYARDIGQTALNNKVILYSRSTDTAPNASAIHVLGSHGSPIGLSIGLRCSRLHVDLSRFTIYQFLKADQHGSTILNPVASVPYTSKLAGLKIYGQAAWKDSSSNQMLLTNGMETTIASQPENPFKRFMIHGGPNSSTGTFSSSSRDNPIPLYTYK